MTDEITPFSKFMGLVSLSCRLAELIAAGLGESDEAEQVRDLMDPLYDDLDPEPIDLLREITADLYLLSHKDFFNPTNQDIDAYRNTLNEAINQSNWQDVLILLRERPKDALTEATIARLRAIAYERSGFTRVALCFYRLAFHDDPLDLGSQFALLNCAWSSGENREAVDLARALLANPQTKMALVMNACRIIVSCARNLPKEEAIADYQRIVQRLEALLSADPDESTNPGILSLAWLTLSSALDALNRPAEATRSLQQAVAVYPAGWQARVVMAVRTFFNDRSSGVALLKNVADQSVRLYVPFFFLAFDAMERKNYDEALEYVERVRERSPSRKVLATITNWRAVALGACGRASADQVYNLLLQAVSWDPHNEIIKHNLNIAKSITEAHGTLTTAEWRINDNQVRDLSANSVSLMEIRERGTLLEAERYAWAA